MNRNNTGHRPGAGGNHKKRGPTSAVWAVHYATKKQQRKDHRHHQLDSSAAVAINAGVFRPTLANHRKQLGQETNHPPEVHTGNTVNTANTVNTDLRTDVNTDVTSTTSTTTTTNFQGFDANAKLIFDDLNFFHDIHPEAIALAAATPTNNSNKGGRTNSNSNSNSNSNNNKLTVPKSSVMKARKIFWKRKLSTLSTTHFAKIWNEARNKFLWNIYHNDTNKNANANANEDADADAYNKEGSVAHGPKKSNQFTGSTEVHSSLKLKSGGNANANANITFNANGHGARASGKGQTSMAPQAPSASALHSFGTSSKSVEIPQVLADHKDKDTNNAVIDLCDSSDDDDDDTKSKNAADSAIADDEETREQQVEDILVRILNTENSTTREEPEGEPTTTARQPRSLTNRWSKLFLGPDFRSEVVFSLDEGDEML